MASLYLLHDLYHVRRLKPETTLRGIVLPDTAHEEHADAEVLAAGPGRANGMHASAGDRVLCEPQCFEPYERTREGETGFVRDSDLIGVIRAPDFSQVEPCNDAVLLKPDPRQWERTLPSGVVVTQTTLPGDDQRRRARAFDLHEQLQALRQSEKYRDQPSDYYRVRMEQDFWSEVPADEAEAWRQMVGARRLTAEENRAHAPFRLADRMCSGVVYGLGPDAETQAGLGERVAFNFYSRYVRCVVGGELFFLIGADNLDCVIPHGCDVQIGAAA